MSIKNPVKIGVDASTRDDLRSLKKGGDTFDDVVRRLLDAWVEAEIRAGTGAVPHSLLPRAILDIEKEEG